MRKKRRYPQVNNIYVIISSINNDIAEEIKGTEQNQEEGPETKTFESSRKIRHSKSNEKEQLTEKRKPIIETNTGKLFFKTLNIFKN